MAGRAGLFARRAGAYGVDYAVIAAYALALAGVTLGVAPSLQLSNAAGYGVGLATLTGPVILVFAALEARFGATPGKAALGLRVRSGAARPGFAPSLVRNVIKFLPWEIAHMGIWLTPGQPFIDPPGLGGLIFMNTAMGLIAVQAVLIGLFGAGVHDWIAGLRVGRRR